MKIIQNLPRKKKKTRGRYGEGSVYKNGHLYWYKIPTPDGPKFGSCKTDDYEAALRVLARERLAVQAASTDAPPSERERITTIDELLDLYLAEYRKKPDSDADDTERKIDKHVRPWFGARLAISLIPSDLVKYRAGKTSQGLSDTTVNRHFAWMRAAYAKGYAHGLVTSIPAFPKTKENNRRTGILDSALYPVMLEHLPDPCKPLLICGYHWGIRSGELRQYRFEMIDWKKWLIRVPARIRKNREDGIVPIIEGEVRDAIIRQREIRDESHPNCPWMFFWYGPEAIRRARPGSPIRDFRSRWKAAAAASGVPDLMPHDLRRTATTMMIEDYGFSPEDARLITGHKTDSMIQRYRIGTEKSVLRVGEKLAAAAKRGKHETSY